MEPEQQWHGVREALGETAGCLLLELSFWIVAGVVAAIGLALYRWG